MIRTTHKVPRRKYRIELCWVEPESEDAKVLEVTWTICDGVETLVVGTMKENGCCQMWSAANGGPFWHTNHHAEFANALSDCFKCVWHQCFVTKNAPMRYAT